MTRTKRATLAAITIITLSIIQWAPTPAAASTCVIPGGNVTWITLDYAGHTACAKVIQTFIDHDHYWISWYFQELTDHGTDVNAATLQIYDPTTSSYRARAIDTNSADHQVQSGYLYMTDRNPGFPGNDLVQARTRHSDYPYEYHAVGIIQN